MVRAWIVIGLMLTCVSAHAAVSAQLSAQNIDELETVRLSIRITETRQTNNLDLSELEQDFEVLNINSMSQSRYVNGRGQSWVDYQITLQPRRTGSLHVPPIKVGSEVTPSLTLHVNPLSDETRRAIGELVFFEAEVSSESIYVQAELIYTRSLLYSQGVQLYSDLPGPPQIEDAVVLTLGETTSGTIERSGRTYGVVQQRYAIFPETSGTLTIPGIDITASVRLTDAGRISRKGVRVAIDDRSVTVRPVPASYPQDAPWLPATNVHIAQNIAPADTVHNVGDTLEHKLVVQIQGNIGTISPPLPLDVPHDQFRVYPQTPQISDDTQGDTVRGVRLQSSSVVPLAPGNLALPQTRLVWWDTVNDRMRIALASGTIMSVVGEAVAQVTPAGDGEEISAPDTLKAEEEESVTQPIDWQSVREVIGAIAVIGLIAVAGWLLLQRRPRIPAPTTPTPPVVTLKALRRAISSAPPAEVHQVLLNYVAARQGCSISQSAQTFCAFSAQGASGLRSVATLPVSQRAH